MPAMTRLTPPEIAAVYQAFAGPLADRHRAMFNWLFHTGFRISELLSLTWGDVLRQDGTPRESVTVLRRHTKTKTESRRAPMTAPMRQTLVAWHQCFRRRGGLVTMTTPLWCSLSGRRITRQRAHAILVRAYEIAGIDPRGHGCHGVRKSHGDYILEEQQRRNFKRGGVGPDPVRSASKSLGHRDIASTDVYLGHDVEELQDIRRHMPSPADL